MIDGRATEFAASLGVSRSLLGSPDAKAGGRAAIGSVGVVCQEIHSLFNGVKELNAALAEHGNRVEDHLLQPGDTDNGSSLDKGGVVAGQVLESGNGFAAE